MGLQSQSYKLEYTVTVIALKSGAKCLKARLVKRKLPLAQSNLAWLWVCVCSHTSAGEDTCSSVDFHLTTLSLHVSSHAKNREGASKQAASLLLQWTVGQGRVNKFSVFRCIYSSVELYLSPCMSDECISQKIRTWNTCKRLCGHISAKEEKTKR